MPDIYISTSSDAEMPLDGITGQEGDIYTETGIADMTVPSAEVDAVQFHAFSVFGIGVIIGILLIGEMGGKL